MNEPTCNRMLLLTPELRGRLLKNGRESAGKDEEAYLQVLDRLTDSAAADLDRLRRKIERQDTAIEALCRKYRVNAERPTFTPL